MKKLLSVMVLVSMLAICSSSHAFFIIYKLSAAVKGVDSVTGLRMSIPLKGYLVLNNTDEDSYSFQDANLILYGKQIDKTRVFVELNYNGNQFLTMDSWVQGYSSYEFIYLSASAPFQFEGYLYGKFKNIYVSYDRVTTDCAPSSKGVFFIDGGLDDGGRLLDPLLQIAGTATITTKIWTSFTQFVNDDPEYWTQDEIVQYLKDVYLADYLDVTP